MIAGTVVPNPDPLPTKDFMRVVKDPLLRYRVMANVVGVGLVILVFIGIPLQVWGNSDGVVEVVGPLHGFLYIVYLVVAFELAVRRRWPIWKALLVLGAGTVPLLSFIVERWVTRNDPEHQAQQSAATPS